MNIHRYMGKKISLSCIELYSLSANIDDHVTSIHLHYVYILLVYE